jgi:hypothetical protein
MHLIAFILNLKFKKFRDCIPMVSTNILTDNLQTIILWGSSAVILGLAALYTFQTRLIYLPQFPPGARTVIWRPSECGFHPKDDEEIFLTVADGTSVHGYWLSSENVRKGSPTFIYFQGNAGNIVYRHDMVIAI